MQTKGLETPTIGLIPAAGSGSRLGKLPFSKELMPIGFGDTRNNGKDLVTAIGNAIEVLVENDITRQHVVIAPGKRDIPAYLADGARFGASIAYHVAAASPGVPHSLDAAFPSTQGHDVVLLFPDIVFHPREAPAKILASKSQGDADVVLALVPSERGDKVDIVEVDDKDRVLSITAKPGAGYSGWTWVSACWGDSFTAFLHRYLARGEARSPQRGEVYVGDVFNAAMEDGFRIRAVRFAAGEATDIGTADDLAGIWSKKFSRRNRP